MAISPKKHLGQHFLVDANVADKVVSSFDFSKSDFILEIGPGTGVLSQRILRKHNLTAVEIDTEALEFLKVNITGEGKELRLVNEDFLKINFEKHFGKNRVAVVGNFPYNISTQIIFKVIENRHQIPFFGGMFQREVALRICTKHGSKTYGILSVIVGAFYHTNYEFTVSEKVFYPPPKVKSAVITMTLKSNIDPICNNPLFFNVIKSAFQQRRKMLSNSLKIYNLPPKFGRMPIFKNRPEQLSIEDFVYITKLISEC